MESIRENLVEAIIVFSAFLFILSYFGVRATHLKRLLAKFIGWLRQVLPKLVQRYLLVHPYIGLALAVCLMGTAAFYTYRLVIGMPIFPVWFVVFRWFIVILFYVIVVPIQIKRIRGIDWPP